jgi:hypothetical protein
VGDIADGPGEDLHGVGAGVQHEGQQGAVQRVAEEAIEHFMVAYHFQPVEPGVADQQLDIERRTAEQVGVELHRPAQPRLARDSGQGQWQREEETEDHGDDEQPQGHGQP